MKKQIFISIIFLFILSLSLFSQEKIKNKMVFGNSIFYSYGLAFPTFKFKSSKTSYNNHLGLAKNSSINTDFHLGLSFYIFRYGINGIIANFNFKIDEKNFKTHFSNKFPNSSVEVFAPNKYSFNGIALGTSYYFDYNYTKHIDFFLEPKFMIYTGGINGIKNFDVYVYDNNKISQSIMYKTNVGQVFLFSPSIYFGSHLKLRKGFRFGLFSSVEYLFGMPNFIIEEKITNVINKKIIINTENIKSPISSFIFNFGVIYRFLRKK